MNLLIEIECEDDGRWIAEVPELPGVTDRCAKRFKFFAIVFAETRTRDSLKIPEKWGFSGAWDMPAPSNAWGKT